jgi:hypothetical protein
VLLVVCCCYKYCVGWRNCWVEWSEGSRLAHPAKAPVHTPVTTDRKTRREPRPLCHPCLGPWGWAIILHMMTFLRIRTLCTISPPLAMNSSNTNWEKNEMLYMRLKLRCFTRYTGKYLRNYTQHYAKTCKTRVNPHKRPQRDNKQVAMN